MSTANTTQHADAEPLTAAEAVLIVSSLVTLLVTLITTLQMF